MDLSDVGSVWATGGRRRRAMDIEVAGSGTGPAYGGGHSCEAGRNA